MIALTPEAKYQSYITELRRGSLTMATLLCLRTSRYGYALLETMQKRNIDIEGNTLYPLLRRLEEQGLLTSTWDVQQKRPRKYYLISAKGEQVLQILLAEWQSMQDSIAAINEEGAHHG